MSQARVTDFFSQRKRGVAGPVKPAKPAVVHVSRTRSRSSNKDKSSLCSSSVHAEFVRVIDEAVELSGGPSAAGNPAEDRPSSPRTPKRSLAENEFDLGGAVFSATADHSTAKKRRQAEGAKANNPKKETRTRARKKLVLPQDSPQAAVQPSEVTLQHPTPPAPVSRQKTDVNVPTSSSPQSGVSSRNTKGPAKKVLSKEDLVTLKSRLQKIKKQAEEITSAAPTAAASSSSSSSSASAPHSTKTTKPAAPDARSLKVSVAQAKELAAKALRRKEEREAEESTQSDTPTQDSELPAYQRYHTLAQAAPPGLSLPYHYKLLGEMFRSMDTLVGMLHNRCETATFPKIKQGVQDMMHKRFEESHVCQIKTVFPEAYTFRQEKNIPTFNSSIKKGSYQLTVEPVIPSDQSEARPLLLASRLLERRQVFHHNLVSIVKQHHQVFLSSLVPPVSVPDDKLTRWHPKFNVDTVPAVPLSSLPQPPHTEKLSTAQEVLDKARSFITPKMEKALVSLAKKTEDKAAENKETTPPQNPAAPEASAPVPTALKGLSQSLLDRIRAKEAQKIQAAMTRNPDHEDRLLMMSRLPELARILRSVFVAEKKPALIMEVACNRTVASYRSALSSGEMEKHLRLLAEVAADWLTIHPVRKDFYLKLNKNMELNIVLDKLSSRLREEERL
ncbi:DNA replication factor Cdt1 [Centropristis striata]|uniref:DNA replication factor Cdt1 n=1 Tax=Centropristis striata TaxID=184440 RepID=UPI0027E12E1F|nr:DNA replication factor Cdt1 [Centropristis striata]